MRPSTRKIRLLPEPEPVCKKCKTSAQEREESEDDLEIRLTERPWGGGSFPSGTVTPWRESVHPPTPTLTATTTTTMIENNNNNNININSTNAVVTITISVGVF
ncbi:hypothetical protein E2C01_002461 [Portunus trituberculatus]|uniref:Uncharacterized protein n=1 Tax=Portunus trituberculatus TaxID=210409 RepID=A0A5B7CQT1_PORTR|nr:hypothetical protein [Portunus trituberculatus]